ncbi:hypothetical protein GMORB2_1618 [Geosmithia morbida]|uniref:HTH TFE/IIEalpha-type domain-containing protein n=1 Tax=Geosmithia morbida TaxID=1094350 RepID=A0A9P4YU19_9HYPO|nr:uncharacterized protein GMORB2_1618 [Geosmithia morbida]KAF4121779.1 hypothetical protein GMORB2_1618 [Geosmithia morbida]
MDLAVTLVKSVMRAFYQTREILVIDALILHETLRDDDLAYLMAINTKDLHKICGKLREDRFLTVTWYYINYRHTIDAIKWRVYTIDKEVQGTTVQTDEKKEYFCSHCEAEWTMMEVLDHSDDGGFRCHRCNHHLTFEANRNPTGHEQSTRLNDQFKFITELLPKIDAVFIPECDFDKALAKARPVVRDATHQRAATIAVDPNANRPMAVKGLTNTGPQSIAVNISTSEGPSEAEKEAERARKEQIAKQNALPSWMSNSTVTGESFAGAAPGKTEAVSTVKKEPGAKETSQPKTANGNSSTQIDDIFEKLKAEQAAERAREAMGDDSGSEEEEEEEEEEDEFEDVPATGGGGSGAGTTGTPSIKREASGDPSRDGDSSDDRSAKRVKIESEVKTEPGVKEEPSKTSGDASEEDEDDEELEFEDV